MSRSAVTKSQPKPSHRWMARLAICLVSILLSVAAAEIGVRMFFANEIYVEEEMAWAVDLTRASSSPNLIYEIRPNIGLDIIGVSSGYDIVTDDQGARVSPSRTAPKNPEIKIALLGDSTSFGWRVNYDETYGELLRQRLEVRTDKSIELRNFSVPGYNSHHNRVTLAEKVLPWQPNLVILHYDHNDADAINDRPDWLMPADYGDNRFHSALIKLTLRRIKLARNRRHATIASDDPRNPEKVYRGYRYAGPQFDRHLNELREMARICRERSIPVVAFVFNTWLERHDDPEQDDFFTLLHRPVRKQLAEMEYVMIDMYEPAQTLMADRKWSDLRNLWRDSADAHPNPEGHRFLADVLYKELTSAEPLVELLSANEGEKPAK